MVVSEYCGHCKATMPLFKEASSEKAVEITILDGSIDEQRKQIEDYGISIRYTPTFIFGCDYYIGAKSKEEYLKMFDKFLKH